MAAWAMLGRSYVWVALGAIEAAQLGVGRAFIQNRWSDEWWLKWREMQSPAQ